MFHMGWFLGYGFGVYGWTDQWAGNVPADVGKPQLFMDMATSLERAGFDYLMLEDSSVVPDIYGSSLEYSLKIGVLRHDPLPLVPLLGAVTSKLGIIATVSTSFYHPFMAARAFTTLDHLLGGRVGINLVTSSPHAAAQNYGMDKLWEHDLRYRMADDWAEAAKSLWDGWDADAVVADAESGYLVDHKKVRYSNYEGEFFRTRGPLNTAPSPQGRPVICQAGGSPAGKDFGAKHADTIIAAVAGVEAMKAYREDISARMRSYGRDPDDCKVLFLIDPILGDTDDEARDRRARLRAAQAADVEQNLSLMSYTSGLDFSVFPLDEPFPDVAHLVNGHQSSVADYTRAAAGGKTLREVAQTRMITESIELCGSPDTVAAQMGEAMAHAGGDGFLVASNVTRKKITEIADGLAPALRRRGLIRDGYAHDLFRDNLLAF
jgi:FMN-dependent oxidoreductase (nitrilotriacetate monooxygenase family)